MVIVLVSRDIGRTYAPWRELPRIDADVALLQEASPPPDDVKLRLESMLLPTEGLN